MKNLISAKVVADSINLCSATHHSRLTTMLVVIPRYILAEFNTHRMFSRNSASSRAVPFWKMVKQVLETPFIPFAWQKDHAGMQGTEYLEDRRYSLSEFTDKFGEIIAKIYTQTGEDYDDPDATEIYERIMTEYVTTSLTLEEWWLLARDKAVECALLLNTMGVTKQLCNRLLEPFMWHTVLVSATEWENFFHQRCPEYYVEGHNMTFRSIKDMQKWYAAHGVPSDEPWPISECLRLNKGAADIHMMFAAEAMWDALNESVPLQLKPGEYHLPFVTNMDISKSTERWHPYEEYVGISIEEQVKISVSKCAAVSYTLIGDDGKKESIEKSIARHDKLLAGSVKHMSPFEHVACAMNENQAEWSIRNEHVSLVTVSRTKGFSGNFRGFIQYRKTINEENKT